MYVMIIGCGRLGAGLARVLSAQGNDVVIVSERVDMKWLGPDFDGVTVEGDPLDRDVLESAGIRKAGVFVAATSEDVTNAMAVQIAKEVFRVPMALARMTDPARERFYREIGLETVCPTSTGINQILDALQRRAFGALGAYLDPNIAGIMLPPGWAGRQLGKVALPEGRRAIGLERKGRLFAAEAGLVLTEGDILILRRRDSMEAQS